MENYMVEHLERLKIRANMPNYIVMFRDIKNKTGFDFLSNLDKRIQIVIETKKAKVNSN
jgi:hypothetical protein